MEGSELRIVATTNPSYDIRYETLEGTRYMVVPVVMMREGVHAGTSGPVYYPPEVFGAIPPAWNGVPIVIDHTFNEQGMPVSANAPQFAGQMVGRIYNTKFEDSALEAEAWIDEARIQKISPAAYNAIMAKKPLNVSTGSMSMVDNTPGTWQGEQYQKSLTGWIPDHLALLPNAKGACSWEDGCGIGFNSETDLVKNVYHKIVKFVSNVGYDGAKFDERLEYRVLINEGYKALVNIIARKLDAMDDGMKLHFLEEVYSDNFVYRIEYIRPEGRGRESAYYKRGYEYREENNALEFTGEAEQVNKVVNYVTVNSDTGGQEHVSNKKCTCSEDKATALIDASEAFTSEDKDMIMNHMSEEKVDKLLEDAKAIANAKADKGGDGTDTGPSKKEITLEEAAEVIANNKDAAAAFIAKMKPNDVLSALPEDVQANIQRGLEADKEKHTTLVNKLKEAQSEFTEDELKTMNVLQLERFLKAVGDPSSSVDYSAMGSGILGNAVTGNAGAEEVLPLPTSHKKEGGDA